MAAKSVWQKAVDAIRMSVEMLHDGVVEVLTTVTRENLLEIPDIVDFVHNKLGAWSVVNPINVPPGHSGVLSASRPDWAPPFPEDLVDDVYDRLERDEKVAGPSSGFRPFPSGITSISENRSIQVAMRRWRTLLYDFSRRRPRTVQRPEVDPEYSGDEIRLIS